MEIIGIIDKHHTPTQRTAENIHNRLLTPYFGLLPPYFGFVLPTSAAAVKNTGITTSGVFLLSVLTIT